MAQKSVNIPLAKGPVAIVIVAALLIMRFLSIGESKDPDLQTALQTELLSKMGASVSQAIDNVDASDGNAVDALVRMTDAENIRVHSAKVSKPMLSFGSTSEAIVRVEYTLPEQDRTVEYWRFDHSAIAGWRYRRPSSVVLYYLNFF